MIVAASFDIPYQVQKRSRWNSISIRIHSWRSDFNAFKRSRNAWENTMESEVSGLAWMFSILVLNFYFGGLVIHIGFAIKRFVAVRVTYLHTRCTYVSIATNEMKNYKKEKTHLHCMYVCVFCQSNELVTMIWYSFFFCSSLVFIYARVRAHVFYWLRISLSFSVSLFVAVGVRMCECFLFLYVSQLELSPKPHEFACEKQSSIIFFPSMLGY